MTNLPGTEGKQTPESVLPKSEVPEIKGLLTGHLETALRMVKENPDMIIELNLDRRSYVVSYDDQRGVISVKEEFHSRQGPGLRAEIYKEKF